MPTTEEPRPPRIAPARLSLPDGWPAVRWCTTTRADGDFAIDGDPAVLEARRWAVVDLPWAWLRQVHGAGVLVVDTPDDAVRLAGRQGDALVSGTAGLALAVQTADCGPVVLASPEGVIGIAHAGWRGIEAGVVAATVAAMRRLGATELAAVLGPCIHVECYEFTGPERGAMADRFGAAVAGWTDRGTPALDVPAAVRAALLDAGVRSVDETGGGCTACDAARWYSHRARGEHGRMATVVWRDPA